MHRTPRGCTRDNLERCRRHLRRGGHLLCRDFRGRRQGGRFRIEMVRIGGRQIFPRWRSFDP
jgi:hypothetical protein